jgi:D-amino-acid dehydrogenase
MSQSQGRVIVVGGGVVGAACGYYLGKAGRSVTIIDRAGFGEGCSFANCGYVCPSHVLPLAAPGTLGSSMKTILQKNPPLRIKPSVVLRDPGWFLGFARKCNESDMLAAGVGIQALLNSSRSLYEQILNDERMQCEWEAKGLLFIYRTAEAMEHYAATDKLLSERFGTSAKRLDSQALAALEPALKPGLAGAYHYEGDAQLRPDRLMKEFRRVLETMGVTIREHSPVTGFLRSEGRVSGVRTKDGELAAEDVVVATGAWSTQLAKEFGGRIPIQPGKGYSITYPKRATDPTYPMIFEEDRVAISPFPSGLRVGSTMEFAGYDESLNPQRLGLLTSVADRYLREPVGGEPVETWWGWRPMTPDGLPLIGPSPKHKNLWIAAGHNMLGLSMAPASGRLLAEMLTGQPPHIPPQPYSPSRF